MNITLKDTFDKDELERARLEIELREVEIKLLQSAVEHYKRLCRHRRGYSYVNMLGTRSFRCDDCGFHD